MSFTTALAVVCFQAMTAVPAYIPETLCLNDISLDTDQSLIRIDEAEGKLPAVIKDVSISRRNEDWLNFKANVEIAHVYEGGCSEETSADLTISGRADNWGAIDSRYYVELNLTIQTMPDACHSTPRISTISYRRL